MQILPLDKNLVFGYFIQAKFRCFFSDVNVQNFMTERKQLQVKKLCPFEEICDILKKNHDK